MAGPSGGEKPSTASSFGEPRGGDPGLAAERYRALVQNFPNSASLLVDPELRFVLVDGPEVAATGFSKEQMEGKTIHEALPPEFARAVEGNLKRVLAGEAFSAEIPFEDRLYLYNYQPIRDEAGRVVYGLVLATNVTARHRAEQALRKSEDRLSKIFNASPEAIGVTRVADGALIDMNPAFVETFGWTREEALGRSTVDLGLWVDTSLRPTILDRLREAGRVDGLEVKCRRKDGWILDGTISLRPLDLDGVPCLFFVFRDISDRVRALRELSASESRLKGLSDATFEGIAITDQGRIVDVNDQLARMYRVTRAELLGTAVVDLVAPESRDLVRKKLLEDREDAYEHVALRPDGSRFFVEVRSRISVVNGARVRFTAIRDLTQRKAAEAERERLIAELRARNAQMEQFSYTVSHDLKSPLVTITGFLGMLERDLAAGDVAGVRADAARIGSAATKMMRLLNDLLDLSRIGRVATATDEVSLGEVVQEALELVAGPIAGRRVDVRTSDGFPVVRGDRGRLVQVFQNLIENAVKYMGNQSDPRIEIGVRSLTPERVDCFVRDNGIGVDPAYAEKIFGLFEKLDPKAEGTGVGLALVRRILDFHGGGIHVESDGKSGSSFVFHLPVTRRERETP
ncbi:MAG TPA: PAS domain-containing sensor histidine kinase [Polyangiaceae bacterium]|nr:PAS domain-containing sensor histidine kinase [Polyangiaceae bacterium]